MHARLSPERRLSKYLQCQHQHNSDNVAGINAVLRLLQQCSSNWKMVDINLFLFLYAVVSMATFVASFNCFPTTPGLGARMICSFQHAWQRAITEQAFAQQTVVTQVKKKKKKKTKSRKDRALYR